MFWVAPTSWSGTNEGGTGPGEWGRLLEVGAYTTNASYGWWSLYLDDVGCNLYFSAQGNDGSQATFLTEPIDWTTNRWHQVALTWSATNSALYMDGDLLTIGLPVTCGPGLDALTNGFFIGSDSSGNNQAHAMFDDLATYGYPLDPDTIGITAAFDSIFFYGNPNNSANMGSGEGGTNSSSSSGVVTGAVFFQYATNMPNCSTNSNVWMTNVVATVATNGTMSVRFGISGGYSYLPYDVWVTGKLFTPALASANWTWLGQGYSCDTYLITNLPTNAAYLMLTTPQDTDQDGLTDGFELLLSHTNPNLVDSNTNGIADGDELSPNGLPWKLVQALLSSAIIYPTVPTATAGGSCGQFTIYLPHPAPAGGVTLQYRVAGMAVLNTDFVLSPAGSSISIPAGASSAPIDVCAVNNGKYADMDNYVEVTLTNSSSGAISGVPARVEIVNNALPGVRVFAMPPWLHKPSPTYGTNSSAFYFIRDGAASNALTLGFSLKGTATNGMDYATLPVSVTFPAGVATNLLPVLPLQSSASNSDSAIILALTSAPGYQYDPQFDSATVTFAAVTLPALPSVQVVASDDDARQTGPVSGQLTFVRTAPTNTTLRVFYHVWGSAIPWYTNGVGDYLALPGYIDIPAGAASATAAVTPYGGSVLGIMETVVATLGGGGDYTIGTSNSATVYIDANQATSYAATIQRDGVYGSSVNQDAEVQVVRYGSALASARMHYGMSYGYIDNTLVSSVASGDVSGQDVYWAARQSVANVKFSTAWATYYDATANPTLTLSNAVNNFGLNLPYLPPSAMVSVAASSSPATTISRGATQTGALIFTRPHPNANAFTMFFTVAGSATYNSDYTINTPAQNQVTFSANQTTVSVPASAFVNSQKVGWQTAVVTPNPGSSTTQVGVSGQDRAFLRIQDPQNTVIDTDMDGDGIPDGWELNNMNQGYDPLVPNNPYTDSAHDGVDLIEDLALGTDPNAPAPPPVNYPSPDDSDYVDLTLRVGDAGKLPNPLFGCAICHEASVLVGPFIRTCPRNGSRGTVSEDFLIRFLRGTNYPVRVTATPSFLVLPSSKTNAASPHYTAVYTAQFLTDNGVWPLVTDTNTLLGANRPLVSEALGSTATLYIPDMIIAADADRNGVVDFTNRVDRTSTNQPFTFWINDDYDYGNDDTASDLEPVPGFADSNYPTIQWTRDLEDFARIQFKIEGLPGNLLTNAGLETCIYLTNLVGAPSVRLFPSVETNGGLGYLTNVVTATAQVRAGQLGVLADGTPLAVASTNWITSGSNRFFLPMIFEGILTGQCVIAFGLCSNGGPPLAVSRPFYLNLQSVTNMYEHWTVGDNTNTDWSMIPNRATRVAGSQVYGAPQDASDLDFILFVHGWRMVPWERRAFASTAYKRLWQLGYKGRFGLYSWPTDWTDTTLWDMRTTANRQNYDRSEQRAWNSAIGLFDLLVNLNVKQQYHVRMIAHSMGNVVASEALRLRGLETRPPLIQSYIASQAASVAHAYDAVNPQKLNDVPVYAAFPRGNTNQPYFTGMKNAVGRTPEGAPRIANFNNQADYALNTWYAWPLNQTLKPDFGWDSSIDSEDHFHWYRLWIYPLDIRSDYDEIFAHAATASSKALGCSEDATNVVRGEVGDAVNLASTPFNLTANDYDHSGEFNSINMNRRLYWWQLLGTFSLTNGLPQP